MNTINLISLAILTICLVRYCMSGGKSKKKYVPQPIRDSHDDQSESKQDTGDKDEEETQPLNVIQKLEEERKENQHFAKEFLQSGRIIERYLNGKSGHDFDTVNLRDFILTEIPGFVTILADIKMVIFPLLEDTALVTTEEYEIFEKMKVREFEMRHKELMRNIASDNVTRLRHLYVNHVAAFQQRKDELEPHKEEESESEEESEEDSDSDGKGFTMNPVDECCNNTGCNNSFQPIGGGAHYLY